MKTYKQLFSENKKAALIPFFVIGDPDFDASLKIVKAAIDAGADVLELGIPFSDPIADGPTIQKADIRALDAGMNINKARQFISEIKKYKDIPIGLLMYYNLIFQYGIEKFYCDFAAAGVNSVLIADLAVDDAGEVLPFVKKSGMDTVFMVAPNTPDERMVKIVELTTGFIYTVSLMGVTGSRQKLSDAVKPLVARLKKLTNIPICVGFGVSSPQHAAEIASAGADGVIIGSRIVSIIEENLNDIDAAAKKVSEFIRQVKQKI